MVPEHEQARSAALSRVQAALEIVTDACYDLDGPTAREQVDALIVVQKEAGEILATTIATENGRTFPDRETFSRALAYLAVLSQESAWDFLRGG